MFLIKNIEMHRVQQLICLLLLVPVLGFSQKKLSIEDASGMNRSLYPQSLLNLQWIGDTDQFSYLENNTILKRSATGAQPDTLLRLPELNAIMGKSGLDSLARMPGITWISSGEFTFSSNNKVFRVNLQKKTAALINTIPADAENPDLFDVGSLAAYTIGNNLYISDNGVQTAVTSDEIPGIVNGQTVHRNEFGISKGTFWSPCGNYLAYYRKDETMVTEYPLVDIDTRIATVKGTRYPMAGMTSEQVTLVIYDRRSGKSVTVQTGEPADQYLTAVTWSPDSRSVLIGLLNRGQNHLRLNRYDAGTGVWTATLFEEKHEKYVEPEHPVYFLDDRSGRFIWMSERDGYQHLYLYGPDGTLTGQLTRGAWVVTEYLGTDPKNTRAYFLSTKNSPLNEDIFSVEFKTGRILDLSLNKGTHSPIFSKSGKYFIDIYQDTIVSREYAVVDTRGRVEQVVFRSPDPLDEYERCTTHLFRLRAADGTDLYSRMIYPPGFDPRQKYPVIVYVYGGPHSQLVTNSWLGGSGLFLYYLASQGYIVFTLDNRGSSDRGREFEQAIFRDLGSQESEDQMTGVNFLRDLPYVDDTRIGVHGWSYGGFMTISLMLRYPEVFKAGVCGGPVTDWKYYEVMYGERYMDTPEENPEGYKNASLLEAAGKLRGNLLVIHGTADPVVVWQHSLALMKRFIEEGIQADYFVYPGHEHGVGGKDRIHLNRKIEKYFNEHL